MAKSSRVDPCFSLGAGPWAAADSRVDRVVRLSNQGEFEEAGKTAETLIAEGVHDVRVVVRFLFDVFVEEGFACLPWLFDGLERSLTGASEALGVPGSKLKGEVDVAFVWLCRTMRDRVDFHHAQRDGVFKAWVAACDGARIEGARAAAMRFRERVEAALPGSRSLEHIAALDAFLGGALRGLIAKPPPRPPPVQPPEPVLPPPALEAEIALPEPRSVKRDPPPSVRESVPHDYESPALLLVQQKIAGFESLMARGEFARAAIVARDIDRIVESFDPRVYLPRLFATFYKRLATGVEDLTPHLENAQSFSWKALEQLYQVDLPTFLGDE